MLLKWKRLLNLNMNQIHEKISHLLRLNVKCFANLALKEPGVIFSFHNKEMNLQGLLYLHISCTV
jgi:hypothetical protein